MFDSINVGDRLEITLWKERNFGKAYVSQVEEIISENELLVHMPISYGQLVKLLLTERYAALFFTEKGMLNFEAQITGYKKDGAFHYMTMKLVSDGEWMQRREFFRFSTLLPVKFSVVAEEGQEVDEDGAAILHEQLNDGIIKDIGGGGIRFVTNESVEADCRVKAIIMLGEKCLIAVGKLLHKQCFPKANFKYQYRIQFVGILPPEREEIIQFIFNEQRKLIQRGRI